MPAASPHTELVHGFLRLKPEQREKVIPEIATPDRLTGFVTTLASMIDVKDKALREASDAISELRSINEKITAPPLHLGVFLSFASNDDGSILFRDAEPDQRFARIALRREVRVVSVHPDADPSKLLPGREVCLNHMLNCIVSVTGRVAPHEGTTAQFERTLSGGRIEVSHREEKVVLTCAAEIDLPSMKSGDLVVIDRDIGMAFEKIEAAPASHTLFKTETPDVPADAVGGNKSQLRKLRSNIVTALHEPAKAARYDVKELRGILLEGPAGTGKTLSVRSIASEFTRSGRHTRVAIVKLSDILSPFIGVAEANITRLFSAAREEAKKGAVLLFMDEIESIGRHRGGWDSQHFDRFLTCFLTEIDGFMTCGNVCVIGATNRKDLLDAALVSRFGTQIKMPRPDLRGAREIFAIHLHEKLPFHPNGAEAPATRAQLVETAVSLLYAPNADAQIARLRFRDSKERIVHARELVCGRLIRSITEAAKTSALQRDCEGGTPGLCITDIEEAVADAIDNLRSTLTAENARHYLADLPQDMAIVACEPLRPKVSRKHHLIHS